MCVFLAHPVHEYTQFYIERCMKKIQSVCRRRFIIIETLLATALHHNALQRLYEEKKKLKQVLSDLFTPLFNTADSFIFV